MKISLLISSLALLTSLVTLTAAIKKPATTTQAEIDAMVDSRLAAREQAFVRDSTPKFRRILGTADREKFGDNWSPKSMEELFDPIVRMIETMGEDTSPSDTQPSTDDAPDEQNDRDKPSN